MPRLASLASHLLTRPPTKIGAQLRHILDNPNEYGTPEGDVFGTSVAIHGNRAIVGAWLEDDSGGNSAGKAYIFNTDTGALLHTLNNPNAYSTSEFDYFGIRVAVSENYYAVSARGEDDANGTNSGKVYVYNSNGTFRFTINNPNPYSTSLNDSFGSSICIIEDSLGDLLIVGAPSEDEASREDAGKVYAFRIDFSLPTLSYTLNNPSTGTDADEYFGQTVATNKLTGTDGRLLVQAQLRASTEPYQGKVYIYRPATGALLHTLLNPRNPYNSGTGDNFGFAMDADGDYGIIGSYGEGDGGMAFIYNVNTGSLVHTLNNPNNYGTEENDNFGYAVGISDNYAVVGAEQEDSGGLGVGTNAGIAYVFNVSTGEHLYTINNPNVYTSAETDKFGRSISMTANTVIIGAPYEDDDGGGGSDNDSGKAYIFDIVG